MRKLMALVIVGTLLTALTAPSGMAKKGSKKGKDLTLYLRWDDDGSGGCGATYLSPVDDVDPGNGCAFTFQAAQEVLTAAGVGPLTHTWPGALKKPAKLAAGSVVGAFVVRAYASAAATLEVEVTATTKKGSVDIGTFVSDPLVFAPLGTAEVGFELELPKALVGQKIEMVNLSTTFRGVTAQSYIELDNPAATLTFPTK